MDIFSDKSTQSALAGLLAILLAQVAGKYGFVLDPATANQLTLGALGVVAALVLAHGHQAHGEAQADAHVEAAKIQSSVAPVQPGAPSKN